MKPATCRTATLAAVLFLSLGLLAGGTPSAAEDDSAYESAVAEGRALLAANECGGAVKSLRQAERLAAEPDAELLTLLSKAYLCFGSWPDAESYARRAVTAPAEPPAQAEAYYGLGQILYRGGEASAEQTAEAVEAFRKALEISGGRLATVQFDLGLALLELGRDEEGLAVLENFVATRPGTAAGKRAQALIANPNRARVPMIPDFQVTTLDGKRLAAADLSGKVVLLDFWATWCEPCKKAIPALKDLARRSAKEPLVVVGISDDRDPEALRQFVAKNEMGWPQIHDVHRDIAGELGILKIPTYVLVDPKGVVLFRRLGFGSGLESDLVREINKAVKAAQARKAAS